MAYLSEKMEQPAFLADCTLGKLAKWLRLAGFDTRLHKSKPDPNRFKHIADLEHRAILTRTKAVSRQTQPPECLFIYSNRPLEQARQVMAHFQIQRKSLRTLSLCAICNHPLQRISHDAMHGRVPAYVIQRHDQFMTCLQCNRIYWPGTHTVRMNSLFDHWFA